MFPFTRGRRAAAAVALTLSGALVLSACGGGGGEEGAEGPVTLDFAFWGNDARAAMYTEAIDAFTQQNPDVTVNVQFLGFPEFWERRQVEAAGGDLPDVMQFDYSYLRQYGEEGMLLELDEYVGNGLETSTLDPAVLDTGKVDGTQYGVPTSTNAWTLFQNDDLLAEAGVDPYPGGGSWEEYNAWSKSVTEATDGEVDGTTGYTRIQNFEIWLRAQGGQLFTEDAQPGFTKDQLREFFNLSQPTREENGGGVSGQEAEEVYPLSAFDAGLGASELTWDNFGANYKSNLGEDVELSMVEPPVTVEGAQDLYLKPSMLHTISAETEHPEESVALVDFLVNSPEVGAAFGTNRGLPASSSQLEGVDLGDMDSDIKAYEESIAPRLGAAPPAPINGFGSVEEEFRTTGTDLGLGVITVDEAVDQIFREMENLI
ncbi:ABC transporter substrate-binding protein [Auraticoccus monumenti]|uniref:Carbohydrate ABC transporter substrate-binding protein, CUT1 family n=1 Tax=Auraticoccus monumenti TaxID=675864 RepID=A0A1G6SXM0_9ACTN|nr:extracellular solute-binding protein [Auraticoccus monumenti]SDD21612.1 carbohydrate ABC transporter substrate-binding protein, CUT1 family [Auraticoccus monumenti]